MITAMVWFCCIFAVGRAYIVGRTEKWCDFGSFRVWCECWLRDVAD